MQSDRSGQLVGTNIASDDVSHHYSLLNAIKRRGIKSRREKNDNKVGCSLGRTGDSSCDIKSCIHAM